MPIYVYRCPRCLHSVEEIRCVEDRQRAPGCPACPEGTLMGLEVQPVPGKVDVPAVPRRER